MSAAAETPTSNISKVRVGVMTRLTPRLSLGNETELDELAEAVEACLTDGDTRIVLDLSHVNMLLSDALDEFGLGHDVDSRCPCRGGRAHQFRDRGADNGLQVRALCAPGRVDAPTRDARSAPRFSFPQTG